VILLKHIAVSLLKQPRDGVMGCVAECTLGAYDLIVELPEVVMAEYHRDAAGRPIPQIPYVETGNAGERVLFSI
jgi:hypothetical protein